MKAVAGGDAIAQIGMALEAGGGGETAQRFVALPAIIGERSMIAEPTQLAARRPLVRKRAGAEGTAASRQQRGAQPKQQDERSDDGQR